MAKTTKHDMDNCHNNDYQISESLFNGGEVMENEKCSVGTPKFHWKVTGTKRFFCSHVRILIIYIKHGLLHTVTLYIGRHTLTEKMFPE